MGDTSYWLPAAVAVGAAAVGIGFLLVLTQDRTRTTVGIAVASIASGIATATAPFFVDDVSRSDPGLLPRLQGLFDVAVVVAAAFYLDGLRATGQVSERADRTVRWAGRAVLVLAAVLAAAAVLLPAQRLNDYYLSAFDADDRATTGFWIIAVCYLLITVGFVVGYLTLATQRLDPAEALRAAASAPAAAFLVAATVLPSALAWVCILLTALCVLWGQLQYAVAQARRGVFLSRFLSPQVIAQVRSDGITTLMQPHQVELSVVACDLRDFTPYSEAVPSQAVVDLLGDYYEAVGVVVAEHGGTITSYAGDGVLVLVGAPLPRTDHASAALALAEGLQTAVLPVLDRWSTKPHQLGLGVGVATGTVTVGTIEASTRTEYTAVGTAVNLAARLCSAARPGEVLVADRTAEVGGREDLERREAMSIKGFSGLQDVYALGASSPRVRRASDTLSTAPGSTTS